ncbi:MAG: HAD hydrolase family protein [Anaerolineae bacterium]|nr:HAD hydrolase family protein [Anaerolineae bacterium]
MVTTALPAIYRPGLAHVSGEVVQRAQRIRLLLTDCDGVLTDGTVYYSARGEELKRFHMRDGMGVERLRTVAGVDVGIISGENSPSLQRRAAKLHITELHLGIRDKLAVLEEIVERRRLSYAEVAYIGDDVNDVAVMERVGLAACPADATPFAKAASHLVCRTAGGAGVLREVAEIIIAARCLPSANGDAPGRYAATSVAPVRQPCFDERSEW